MSDSEIVAAQLQRALTSIGALTRQVEELTAQQELISALVDEGLQLVGPPAAPQLALAADAPDLRFSTLAQFVDDFVRRFYEQPSIQRSETMWNSCWPDHPQAVWGMEYLWASYEEALVADLESGGGSNLTTWTVGSFIPMMQWITHPTGAFRLCSHGSHKEASLLGSEPGEGMAAA